MPSVLTEQEFKSTKKHLKTASVKSTARTMSRSESCILRIKASKDFKEYKELVRAEHKAKNPRVPLPIQLRQMEVKTLLTIKSKGAFKTRYINRRLRELGI